MAGHKPRLFSRRTMDITNKKERPILFSGPMVRALLDGSKTQTRRVAPAFQQITRDDSPDTPDNMRWGAIAQKHRRWGFGVYGATEAECAQQLSESGCCPYGKLGDRLWVREAWARTYVAQAAQEWIVYREGDNRTDYGGPWKPSIHMPRAASRILLEIVSVRVERLQDISEADAWAEGITAAEALSMPCADGATAAYSALWERINGAGSWDASPWVWVVEFKRVKP